MRFYENAYKRYGMFTATIGKSIFSSSKTVRFYLHTFQKHQRVHVLTAGVNSPGHGYINPSPVRCKPFIPDSRVGDVCVPGHVATPSLSTRRGGAGAR